jgi:hypothetical protein
MGAVLIGTIDNKCWLSQWRTSYFEKSKQEKSQRIGSDQFFLVE